MYITETISTEDVSEVKPLTKGGFFIHDGIKIAYDRYLLVPPDGDNPGDKKDIAVTGKVQSGKTDYIMNAAISTQDIPVIFAWDKRAVLDQLITRFSKSAACVKPIIQINTRKVSFNRQAIYVTILTKSRLNQVIKLIESGIGEGHHFLLIFDESDMSVKSDHFVTENLQTELIKKFGPWVNNLYISATNFAVFNSEWRMSRPLEIHNLHSDRDGFEYRDYYKCDHIVTNAISDLTEYKPKIIDQLAGSQDFARLIQLITESMLNRVDINQPNIGLVKIFNDNHRKNVLGKLVNEALNFPLPQLGIIVYTCEGVTCLLGDDESTFPVGMCIGNVLQEFKDMNFSKPLLILSDRLASRAQTFKTADHQWVLTQLYLDTPARMAVDVAIQSLRCCGQYKPHQPSCTIYASSGTHHNLEMALYNNEVLNVHIEQLHRENKLIPRNLLLIIPFLENKSVHRKFCNRKVDDTKFITSKIDDGNHQSLSICIDRAKILCSTNNCSGIYLISKYLELDAQDYLQLAKETNIPNRLGVTPLQQWETDSPYQNLSLNFQRKVRGMICQKVSEKLSQPLLESCQIGYEEKRQQQLNRIHHVKGKNFQGQIIALAPKDKISIPVVIYEHDYYDNPHKYYNTVLLWHGTDRLIHIWVNTGASSRKLVFNTLIRS